MRSAVAAAVAGTALVAALAACGSSTQGAASPTCDRTYAPPVEAAVTDPGLNEISGIVASRRNPGIYWVHNDSGSGPRITALDGTGSVRGVVDLAGISPIDWEDIAIGPGPVEWRPYLYLADIGDNLLDRSEVAVVRIPEPTVDDGSGGVRAVRDAVTMRFRYPDAPHNAEALVVDPRSGDLYIIVKRSRGGRQPVFRARAPIDAGRTTTLERVATVTAAPSLFGAVTAADIQTTADVEILDQDLVIAHVNASGRLALDLTVEQGRGYLSAEKSKKSGAPIGNIPVDAIFSPVRRVAFSVEPTRVEQATNFDKLTVDIETDGSISPREALASAAQTLGNLVGLIAGMSDEPKGLELGETTVAVGSSPELEYPIEELDLSERPRNCLKRARVDTIGQLVQKTEDDLLAITNFGSKSLEEVIQKLDERGLSLRIKE